MRLGAALATALLAVPAAAEVRTEHFASPSLGRDVAYAIDLPPSYATSGARRYPVVYALHGLFEGPGFWEGRGLADALKRLRDRGRIPELIVVAADGDNSFYVNGPLGKWEDAVVRDLVAHVDKNWRTVPERKGRALLGVSMGGYAALRMALAHPDLFAAAATHSAMLLLRAPTADQGAGRGQMAAFNRAFGDPIDPALWSANDPLELARTVDPKAAPALYFDCGTADRYSLGAGNAELDRRLTARRVNHTYSMNPGDHGYEYVLSVIDDSLGFLGDALKGAAPKTETRP